MKKMDQVGVKAVSMVCFLLALGILVTAGCNFQQPNLNTDPVKAGGILPKPTVYEEKIKIIVTGKVVDVQNRPVPDASVMVSLGMDLEGKIVKTDASGQFIAEAGSDIWTKGGPLLRVWAEGFGEKVVYFDRWDTGTRQFDQTIIMEPETTENNNENLR